MSDDIDRIAMAWESGHGEGHAEGYDLGIQDSMLRATQYERILTDLIAELRDDGEAHGPMKCSCQMRGCKEMVCKDCEQDWPCPNAEHAGMADRAEARLREVTGDE